MKNPPEILIRIVDDDAELSLALAFMLECEGWQTAIYPDAKSFLTGDAPSTPGALVLDQNMPGMSGAQLQFELDRRGSHLPIIFLTAHGDVDLAVQTLRRGAFHFLQKPVEPQAFMTAVAQAVELDLKQKGIVADSEAAKEALRKLTAREREVVKLLAKGLLNKDVAERLGLSVRTVEAHRAQAYKKLGAKSAAELARIYQAAQK